MTISPVFQTRDKKAFFNMVKTYQQKIGKLGESIAENYLRKKDFQILEKNYQAREGEIDIICRQKEKYIFFEIKTRTSLTFGLPEESFDKAKREKTLLIIEKYIQENNLKNINYRIDVMAIYINKQNKKIKIKHFENV